MTAQETGFEISQGAPNEATEHLADCLIEACLAELNRLDPNIDDAASAIMYTTVALLHGCAHEKHSLAHVLRAASAYFAAQAKNLADG